MPAKVIVDFGKCTGHARCAVIAPDVYTLDEAGFNRMGTFDVASGHETLARRGARACPERAIAFVEEGQAEAGS